MHSATVTENRKWNKLNFISLRTCWKEMGKITGFSDAGQVGAD